jgi:CRP-like cAMP-binding protein
LQESYGKPRRQQAGGGTDERQRHRHATVRPQRRCERELPGGSVVFNKGDAGSCMYVVQSGVIEMVIGDTVIEMCGPNEVIGFMSMIDSAPRSSTARVKEACELSVIDQRKFRFMVDEVPNFAIYIMGAMARRIRGMGQTMR